jgi:hypothetical protein
MYLIRYRVPRLRYVRHFCTGDAIGWRWVWADVVGDLAGYDTIVGQVYRSNGKFRVA